MDILDNSVQSENEQQPKGKKIILTSLIIAIILLVLIVILIFIVKVLQPITTTVLVDKKNVKTSETLLVFDEQGKAYFSLDDFSTLIGYTYHSGEYLGSINAKNKCYLEGINEVVCFEVDSDIIYKTDVDLVNPKYSKFSIKEKIKLINNKIYASVDSLGNACNVSIGIKTEGKQRKVEIFTLKYLLSYYSDLCINKYGYNSISKTFNNAKALLYGLVVVEKDSKYGVIKLDGVQIVNARYTNIEFNEGIEEFYFTLSETEDIIKNKGVLTKTGNIKIAPNYEEITVISQENIIYAVKKDSKWGIINNDGEIVLPIENDSIGFETTIAGINSVSFIPSINGIVFCKDNKYGLINSSGKVLIISVCDKIFSKTVSDKEEYYFEYEGTTQKLMDYLEDNNLM